MEKAFGPDSRFWQAAGRAASASVVALAGIRGALMDTGLGDIAEFLAGALLGAGVLIVALALARMCVAALRPVPSRSIAVFAAAVAALLFLRAKPPGEILRALLGPEGWESPQPPHGLTAVALVLLVATVALAAGAAALVRGGELTGRTRSLLVAALALLSLASLASIGGLVADGADPYPTGYRPLGAGPVAPVAAPDPAEPGAFAVDRLTYGAGENARRPEFGAGRDLESRTVDASALLPDWEGVKQRMRESYWGFGLGEAPLNGIAWLPAADAPRPLVLIVHGNHGMEDYSDGGYAYLGELLASRGFITVSVDQNYVNGSWSGDFRGKEMPLRAWLLLEHLRLFRDWNETPGHLLHGRVDLGNVALIGHSRGGEAVSIAHAYNGLPHYPDDATVRFDFGFAIRSLVAIAQVDQRYHRRVELGDVNFLTLHGSYDSDEPAYHGLRQWNRISLGDGEYRFKAGIYVHGANHGQFNASWGRRDIGPPEGWLLNLAPLIAAEDQRRIAQVYISAFLEATLAGDRRYLRLFRDPRAAAAWLPDHAYVHQFTDSTLRPIADYDEDLDVTTATVPEGRITAEGFAVWREEELRHRDERRQGTSAVVLGWEEGDEAVYTIVLPPGGLAEPPPADAVLTFAVSGSTERPPGVASAEDAQDAEPVAPDFEVELTDAKGRRATVRAADFASLAPPLRVKYLKPAALNEERYKTDWEPVLQHVEIPLAAFAANGSGPHLTELSSMRFRFRAGTPGVAILDDVGFLLPVGE